MPKLKTEVLGSLIEIHYETSEKDKLINIINKFKKRLLDYKNLESKVSDKKILFLTALKTEDENIELKNIFSKNKDILINNKKNFENKSSNLEIIKLKDKLIKLDNENNQLKKNNLQASHELNKIEKILKQITDKIISKNSE